MLPTRKGVAPEQLSEELGCSFRDVHRIHEQVIQRAMEKNTMIGNKLETLRSHRVEADYGMNAKIDLSLGRGCVKVSRIIMNSLSQLR